MVVGKSRATEPQGASGGKGTTDVRLRRQSSGQQAADYIRGLIFEGELAPGSRVPQEEIANALGISRIPVREALVALEKEGRVHIEMHRGAFVSGITEQSVRENVEVTDLINTFLIRRLAERGSEEDLDRLQAVQKQIDKTEDPYVIHRLDNEWWDVIIHGTSSVRLAAKLRGIRELVVDNFFEVVPGALQSFRTGSAAITRAIRRRDADEAVKAWNQMSKRTSSSVIAFYKSRNLFEESR